MNARPTLLLFDLDGTLVSTNGIGKLALRAAFREQLGRDDICEFRFHGRTDRAIVRQAFANAGHVADEAAIDGLLERYLVLLERTLVQPQGYRILPGVQALLEQLAASAGRAAVGIGLGTGNIARGAEIKLAPSGLWPHFAFGGFGSDAEPRADLLRIGAQRGAAHIGAPLSDCRVVIIGDTPLDVAAALAIGAECVAVATGDDSVDALRAAGATHAFDDLARPGVLDALLRG